MYGRMLHSLTGDQSPLYYEQEGPVRYLINKDNNDLGVACPHSGSSSAIHEKMGIWKVSFWGEGKPIHAMCGITSTFWTADHIKLALKQYS